MTKHVLVVDALYPMRIMYSCLLVAWGLIPHIADSVLSACRLVVSEGPFDAVICNYDLPDGNAFDLVTWMQDQQLEVPTVVPYGAVQPISAALPNVTMLAKPFDPSNLKAALERVGGRMTTPGETESMVDSEG